jgi:aminopeptidase
VFTGPVEESVNGWVHYTYPAVFRGRVVEGIRLVSKTAKWWKPAPTPTRTCCYSMLDSDPGARYLGEFAIGTNFQIDRFTRSILLDEKIGGSFHTAIGAGYPETGSHNRSVVHWDMICDLRQDSEIRVDGEVIYRNGQFVSGSPPAVSAYQA